MPAGSPSGKATRSQPASKPRRSLSAYKAKRNFKKTPEPSGNTTKHRARAGGGKELFFCVQKHLSSHLHYDFRLEYKGVLLSWAVPKGPSLNPADKRLAMHVEDHPLDYGDFEGVIPEGYGAGIVMLWDRGTWKAEVPDIDAAIKKGDLKFMLAGIKLKGSWVLVRTRGGPQNESGESRSWLLIKHRDAWAGDIDVTDAAPDSVKSFGGFADILAEDKPDVWRSHRPAEGGATGKLLQEVIAQAMAIKDKRQRTKVARAKRAKAPARKSRVGKKSRGR